VSEFFYKIRWRSRGHTPGAHPARSTGPGYEFVGHRALADGGDPRRLDIRASLKDPFGQWQVRQFTERSAIPVTVIADLSQSMHFIGDHDRWASLRMLVTSVAKSAIHSQDAFCLIGADDRLRDEMYIPLTQKRSAILDVDTRFERFQPTARARSEGLLRTIERLPAKRNLIFLVSDFHWPLTFTETLISRLSSHDVIPVVLWDPMETQVPSGRGLLRLRDSETGVERLLWLRQSLKDQWLKGIEQRRSDLHQLFSKFGRPPLFIEGAFHPDALTRYFHHH
jgi:uncharacterized protein (DUF58 family)